MTHEHTYTEDVCMAPDAEIVCWCAGVTKGELLGAIAKGCRSLQDVQTATGACQEGRCRETNPRGR